MANKVIVFGAGKIGRAIAHFLAEGEWGGYEVAVCDSDPQALKEAQGPLIKTHAMEVVDTAALAKAIRGVHSVVSALPFRLNPMVAEACLAVGANYFDLTEDVETTRKVKAIAAQAKPGQVFMPQCGLAPGFISVIAGNLAKRFDKLDTLHMRVGALPLFPSNMLKYNLTWSTDGLINEYCNPCEAIVEGEPHVVLALEGLETFNMEGIEYEAFNTSGGLGSMCETLKGKVRELNYKTIRYLGHRALAHFLVDELRLRDDRATLRMLLERSVPVARQDAVFTFCNATGWKNGRYEQLTDARRVRHGAFGDREWSAIQLTTAAGICAMVDLHALGHFKDRSGMIRQEEVSLEDFLNNRYGRIYDIRGKSPVGAAESSIMPSMQGTGSRRGFGGR